MLTSVAFDIKAQSYPFAFAKTKASIIIVLFEVEVFGALKTERGDFSG